MKLEVRLSSRFKKDLKLAQKQNKNLNLLFSVIEKLANLEKLDEKYKDHSLLGEYKGFRECHLEPDWLLIYYLCYK
jgi:mRNA interferase YafQ